MFQAGQVIVAVAVLGIFGFLLYAAVENRSYRRNARKQSELVRHVRKYYKERDETPIIEESAWLPMSSAPRDGTIVELRCTYGVAPWYGLHRWTNEHESMGTDGSRHKFTGHFMWVDVTNPSQGPFLESCLSWRPYIGKIEDYRDPTNGRQNTSRYWREAVASKHGLPLDYFEGPGVPLP